MSRLTIHDPERRFESERGPFVVECRLPAKHKMPHEGRGQHPVVETQWTDDICPHIEHKVWTENARSGGQE